MAAVEVGLLTVEEACARYSLSLDEFLLWKRAVKTAGVSGLKIKRVQVSSVPPCRRTGAKALVIPEGSITAPPLMFF